MPRGWKDFTFPVTIEAQTIATLKVDIASQSISTLNVNIASSTGTLNVNIASSSTTLNVNIASQSGNLNVNIASSSATLNVNIASSSGTVNVNIQDAMIKISALKLMDAGTLIRLSGYQVSNGQTLWYTVPAGRSYYILSAQLCISHYGSSEHVGRLEVYDGSLYAYPMIRLRTPDNVDALSEALAFTMMKIPAGWGVVTYSNGYTWVHFAVVGVEVA